MTDDFAVISGGATRVEFWSKTRLPLEPKGRLKTARTELQVALGTLVPVPGQRLRASYRETATQSHLFDVENILLYNVGPGNFRKLVENGIELVKENTPPPSCQDSRFGYYHRYEFVENIRPKVVFLAEVEFSLKRLTSGHRPASIWWAAANAEWRVKHSIPQDGFGLSVDASPPRDWRGNPAAVLKPLYDGILSSAHSMSNVPTELAGRLSRQLLEAAERIDSRLKSDICPLGNQPSLVRCYRENTVWSPDDHLCLSSVLRFFPPQGPHWQFRAALSEPWL